MEILRIPGRTASDKLLCNKAFHISNNPKYGVYQKGLAAMVYKCFDKKSARPKNESATTGVNSISNSNNQQLAEK